VHPGSVPTDLAKSEGALNIETVGTTPRMQEIMGKFQDLDYQKLELSAYTFVALCVEEEVKR